MLRRACRIRPLRSVPLSQSIRFSSSLSPPLISIKNATFYKNAPTPQDKAQRTNAPIFRGVDFTLPTEPLEEDNFEAQTWAIVGRSDKTQFLEILGGKYIPDPPNGRSYPYLLSDEIARRNPRARFPQNAIRYLGFSGEGSGANGGTRGAYLSARYESLREETDWTVRQFLRGQTSLNPLPEERGGTVDDEELLARVIDDLRLDELLDMPVANLSNGQMRRARVAKALLHKPEVLLLDDPFMGLDPESTTRMSELLRRLARKAEPRLILAFRPQDPLPDWISHLVILGDGHAAIYAGRRTLAQQLTTVWSYFAQSRRFGTHLIHALPPYEKDVMDSYKKLNKNTEGGYHRGLVKSSLSVTREYMQEFLRGFAPSSLSEGSAPPKLHPPRGGEPLIEMEGVRVQYGDKAVLGKWSQFVDGESKEGLHWTVRRGQRWAILGANGSGKTTLLSLITSDHPQTYALPIRLFGRSRLPEEGKPGISIFEVQRRIGHSSPEVHAFFPRQLTLREAIESGFAETFLSRPKMNFERDLDVEAILEHFKPELGAALALPRNTPGRRKGVITATTGKMFPLHKTHHFRKEFHPPGVEMEWADTATFGQLPVDIQRLVLFLRALIHRPDIVILDEPFSGMSIGLRDKCIDFLENGLGPESRFGGLSDEQALIMVSHLREEIPDSMRYYMRLPSGEQEGTFRFGPLQSQSSLRSPKVWNMLWAPPETYNKRSTPADPTEVPEGEAVREDYDRYDWRSV
ncbi:putative ABC transporter [Aspergillus fijiensis CBS 313.89]|uniref:ABC transporter n=1 Tax=Aspergillus fijiensis CBS 313.89 TaxID=1448319 RepID=A0A8G1RLZ7_9EURO|nr:ABC transporter [Aspergillus fijiensis CBS 313.89]RAK76492.1 ABC transporter [Aspergillus fijiensis CBS 313.89]